MIRDNIIRANNWRGDQCRTAPVWQWDYGQVLKVEGVDLPSAYEVHFTDSLKIPAIVQIGNADGVSVPDQLLDTGRTIIAHIYLHATDSSGETVKTITIPVNQRASISNETPTPEQQSAISEAIEALNDAVEGVCDSIDEALAEAKASGEFDGADGVSPTATVTKTGNTATITITDAEGTTTATVTDGTNGQPGQDGVSPTITVTSISGGHRISITDASGTETFDVMNGQNGTNGTNGQDGAPGQDGYSPTVTVTDITGGHTVTITDVDGEHTFNVMDGTTPTVPVTDVQVNWTSVVSNGIASISLPQTVNVSGSTPSITAVADTRYVCGEVSTLDITTPATGIIDVVFTSGSTATVLTVTPPTGLTMKWAGGFDPTSLEANTTYEINIMDGVYGVVGTWT